VNTPPGYPAHLVRRHRLADGRTVTIRPIRPDDADRVRDFLASTSDESRYRRFQKWVEAPSSSLVHFLTDIDYDRHLALVCTIPHDTEEQIVGEARYGANPDGATCDFAVLIDDEWSRSGIAGVLMSALTHAARDRGFEAIEGLVLANNGPMLRFAHALGFEALPIEGELATVRIVRRLQAPSRSGAETA
jgi:acetyltransferase